MSVASAEDVLVRIDAVAASRRRAWALRPVDRETVKIATADLDRLWADLRIARCRRRVGLTTARALRIPIATDAIAAFIDSACRFELSASVSVAEMHHAYSAWAAAAGAVKVSTRALTDALRERGASSARTKRARLLIGVSIGAGDTSDHERKIASMTRTAA